MTFRCPVCERRIVEATVMCHCGYKVAERDTAPARVQAIAHEKRAERTLRMSAFFLWTLPLTAFLTLAGWSALLIVAGQAVTGLAVGGMGEHERRSARRRLDAIASMHRLPAARLVR